MSVSDFISSAEAEYYKRQAADRRRHWARLEEAHELAERDGIELSEAIRRVQRDHFDEDFRRECGMGG